MPGAHGRGGRKTYGPTSEMQSDSRLVAVRRGWGQILWALIVDMRETSRKECIKPCALRLIAAHPLTTDLPLKALQNFTKR